MIIMNNNKYYYCQSVLALLFWESPYPKEDKRCSSNYLVLQSENTIRGNFLQKS